MPIIRFDELEKFDKFGSDCVCFAQANKRLPEEKRKKIRRQWQAAPQAIDPTPFPAPSKSSGVPVGAVRYYWQRHLSYYWQRQAVAVMKHVRRASQVRPIVAVWNLVSEAIVDLGHI